MSFHQSSKVTFDSQFRRILVSTVWKRVNASVGTIVMRSQWQRMQLASCQMRQLPATTISVRLRCCSLKVHMFLAKTVCNIDFKKDGRWKTMFFSLKLLKPTPFVLHHGISIQVTLPLLKVNAASCPVMPHHATMSMIGITCTTCSLRCAMLMLTSPRETSRTLMRMVVDRHVWLPENASSFFTLPSSSNASCWRSAKELVPQAGTRNLGIICV